MSKKKEERVAVVSLVEAKEETTPEGFIEMIKAELNDAIEKQEQEQREEYNKGREDALKYCLELLGSMEH